jgi:hypothetical protein
MTTTADYSHATALTCRIRGEFMELPGLQLDVRQAQRLWGLDAITCQAAFDALVEAGVLARTKRGYVLRRSEP